MRIQGLAVLVTLILSACSAQVAPATAAGTPGQAARASSPAGAASTAPARSRDAAAALDAIDPSQLQRTSPAAAAFLRTYFDGHCQPDERLDFSAVCQHHAVSDGADPSPWPDLIIGLTDDRVASAVLLTPDARPLKGWTCASLPYPSHAIACSAPATPKAQHLLWTTQWSAFFSSAD